MQRPSTDMTATDLVRAARDDPSAFEVLFVREARGLRHWLQQEVGDREIADDLLSETFAEAWRCRGKFKGSEPADGMRWLFGIARNLVLMYHRHDRVSTRARRKLGMSTVPAEGDHADDVVTRIASQQTDGPASAGLLNLPPKQQQAINGRVLRDLDYQDLARELDTTATTARALVSRGLRRLRVNLGQEKSP
jgi:RNA polymerase sigma factor (sigma-70 family)